MAEIQLLTPRLTLRPLQASDDAALLALRGHPEVNRYLDRTPPTDITQARMFINTITEALLENKWGYWAITREDALIGTICLYNFSEDRLSAELGYELHPDYQGQGLMDEAVKKVLTFGTTVLGLRTIEAFTHRDNVRSARLLERNGFNKAEAGDLERFVRTTAP